MSLSKIKVGGWALIEKLTSPQITSIDENIEGALDKRSGQTDTCASAVTFSGDQTFTGGFVGNFKETSAVGITIADRTGNASTFDITLNGQTPYASATGTNRTPGSLNLNIPAPAVGGSHGKIKFKDSGTEYLNFQYNGTAILETFAHDTNINVSGAYSVSSSLALSLASTTTLAGSGTTITLTSSSGAISLLPKTNFTVSGGTGTVALTSGTTVTLTSGSSTTIASGSFLNLTSVTSLNPTSTTSMSLNAGTACNITAGTDITLSAVQIGGGITLVAAALISLNTGSNITLDSSAGHVILESGLDIQMTAGHFFTVDSASTISISTGTSATFIADNIMDIEAGDRLKLSSTTGYVQIWANAGTGNISLLLSDALIPNFQGGEGIIYIANKTTTPGAVPLGGGFLWVDESNGKLRYWNPTSPTAEDISA